MRKSTIALIIILVLLGGLGVTYLYFQWNTLFFSNEGRYDSSNLNYMNVIYENRSDIYAFNEGYSETDSCPWGFKHQGIDYFLINNAKVLAAAPGLVERIDWRDNGEGVENRFYVTITIRFNKSVEVTYNFEPWTQNLDDKDLQLSMLKVQEGDWVELGQEIARFLYIDESAHIHFGISFKRQDVCPRDFFSVEGYNELLGMIHEYHPDWELCYP